MSASHVVVVGTVARHAADRYAAACRTHGHQPVFLGLPREAPAGCRRVEVPSLAAPAEDLAALIAPYTPVGVVPGGELAVPVADRIAALLGLPHNPVDRLAVYREKDAMRAAFAAHGVPQPIVYAVFSSTREASEFDWTAVRFPVIVKPVDGAASFFVTRCETPADVLAALPGVFGHRRSGATGLPLRGSALVEECVDGPEYSADCIVSEGRVREVFVAAKFLSAPPYSDETAHMCADGLAPAVHAEAVSVLQSVADAYRVRCTVLHAEFRLTDAPGGLRVIEVGNRVAGDRISELVELRHGWNLEEAMVLSRVGAPYGDAHHPERAGRWPAYGIRFLFDGEPPPLLPAGVTRIRGERTDAYPRTGDDSPRHISRRTGYSLLATDSPEALRSHLAGAAASTGERKRGIAV